MFYRKFFTFFLGRTGSFAWSDVNNVWFGKGENGYLVFVIFHITLVVSSFSTTFYFFLFCTSSFLLSCFSLTFFLIFFSPLSLQVYIFFLLFHSSLFSPPSLSSDHSISFLFLFILSSSSPLLLHIALVTPLYFYPLSFFFSLFWYFFSFPFSFFPSPSLRQAFWSCFSLLFLFSCFFFFKHFPSFLFSSCCGHHYSFLFIQHLDFSF